MKIENIAGPVLKQSRGSNRRDINKVTTLKPSAQLKLNKLTPGLLLNFKNMVDFLRIIKSRRLPVVRPNPGNHP